MPVPMTVKIILITTMIATQLVTWIVAMARFTNLVSIRASLVHGESIFEATAK